MFGDRDSWFDHELKHHYFIHVCRLCRSNQGVDADELKQHILLQHRSYPEKELEGFSVIEQGRIIPSSLRAQDCPFCDNWALILSSRMNQADSGASSGCQPADILVSLTDFKRHVATHQEQLAVFSVSKGIDDGDSGSCARDGAGGYSSDSSSKRGSFKELAPEKIPVSAGRIQPEAEVEEPETTEPAVEIHGPHEDPTQDFRGVGKVPSNPTS